MYYAVGNTLYRVDLSQQPAQAEVQFVLSGEEITMLKFNLYQKSENMQNSYDLIVGSSKNGKGFLRVYEGRESGGDFSTVKPQVYEGFARIVDAEYKERVY